MKDNFQEVQGMGRVLQKCSNRKGIEIRVDKKVRVDNRVRIDKPKVATR